VHRQRLISAGFGGDEPTLSQLLESYVIVLLERRNLKQVCAILGINRLTLRKWMDAWDRGEKVEGRMGDSIMQSGRGRKNAGPW